MNLLKTALPILLAAQSISAEDNSASAIRELMAKFDRLEASQASHKTEIANLKVNQANLKAKIATLESNGNRAPKGKKNIRRNQEEPPAMPEIPLDISDLTEANMEQIISSVGADEQLSGLLYGIIHKVNNLVGLAKCVSYEKEFRFDGEEDACVFGSEYVDNTIIFANDDVEIISGNDVHLHADRDVYIEADDYIVLESGAQMSYSYYEGHWSVHQYSFTADYSKINGVMFPFNEAFPPYPYGSPLGEIDGDKPASDEKEDGIRAKQKAKFDAMLEEKGYDPIFNTTSP